MNGKARLLFLAAMTYALLWALNAGDFYSNFVFQEEDRRVVGAFREPVKRHSLPPPREERGGDPLEGSREEDETVTPERESGYPPEGSGYPPEGSGETAGTPGREDGGEIPGGVRPRGPPSPGQLDCPQLVIPDVKAKCPVAEGNVKISGIEHLRNVDYCSPCAEDADCGTGRVCLQLLGHCYTPPQGLQLKRRPADQRPIVVDIVMAQHELLTFAIRAGELAPVVDYFVVIEAPFTFIKNSKPLYFTENLDCFDALGDQLYVYAADAERDFGAKLEDLRGGFALEGKLRALGPTVAYRDFNMTNGMHMTLDVDEIPSRETVAFAKEFDIGEAGLKINMAVTHYGHHWDFNAARDHFLFGKRGYKGPKKNLPLIRAAGWECSSCFGCFEDYFRKLISNSHSDLIEAYIRKRLAHNRTMTEIKYTILNMVCTGKYFGGKTAKYRDLEGITMGNSLLPKPLLADGQDAAAVSHFLRPPPKELCDTAKERMGAPVPLGIDGYKKGEPVWTLADTAERILDC